MTNEGTINRYFMTIRSSSAVLLQQYGSVRSEGGHLDKGRFRIRRLVNFWRVAGRCARMFDCEPY